jgi:DNA-binding NtrC family response regulator
MTAGPDTADEPRWLNLFRRSRDPIFVLNQRRQVLYVNPAFEALAQITLPAIRGLVCSTRSSGHALGPLGATLAPPAEVIDGQGQRVRRAFPGAQHGPPWWDIEFLPIQGDEGLLGIVGRIKVLAAKHVSERRTVPVEWSQLRSAAQQRYTLALWESPLPTLQRVVHQARLAARSGCPTMIVGATGTGKQTLARTIHAQGARRELPFIGIDCQCLPPTVIRSLLFGRLGLGKPEGAGAIYLDNPSSLPKDLQAEIASRASEHPQLLAGLPRDPIAEVSASRLIEAFVDAAGLLTIQLPTLQERFTELPNYFLRFLKRAGDASADRVLPPDVIEALQRHTWPGNLDELRRLANEIFAKCGPQPITANDLPLAFRAINLPVSEPKNVPLDQLLEQVERRLIQRALERTKGNKSKAAELLGVWRPRLLRRMETLGFDSAEDS